MSTREQNNITSNDTSHTTSSNFESISQIFAQIDFIFGAEMSIRLL